MNFGYWSTIFFVMMFFQSTILAAPIDENTNAVDGGETDEEEEGSPEYLSQFQELLRCTMGIDGIMDLLAKYNCSDCQRCFKNWNTGYYNLNQRPFCENYEGQLYTLTYEYECGDGQARCLKTVDRCQYETCKLDTKFISCLQNIKNTKNRRRR